MIKRKPRTPRIKTKATRGIQKLKFINYILLFLVLSLSTTFISYYMQKNSIAKEQKTISKVVIKKEAIKIPQINIEEEIDYKTVENSKKDFEEYTKELEKEYVQEVIKKEEPKKIVGKISRPKLAIVIDDVTLQSQVSSVNSIGYDVTMSFLPPSKLHPNSARIAQKLPVHLVHFPMQASASFKFEEEETLHIGDSYEKIEAMVKKLRNLYPKAKYTNNHTGSKFTADHKSMDKLLRALKKYNFTFLDSRTTSKTVAKEYAKKYQVPFLGRNIFLDNKLEYNYILNQLKQAIKIANKTGYAIAIGHPHKITVKVLKEAKPLLKDLDLVFISEMPTE